MFERTRKSIDLEKHWRALDFAPGLAVPSRNDFKPYEMAELIPDIAIGKVREASVEVVMAGSNITDRVAADITGQNYMEFIAEAQRPMMMQLLHLVIAHPVGVCLQMESNYARGYVLALEITILPVCGEDYDPNYVLTLSTMQEGKPPMPSPALMGEPVAANWHGPIRWIDLGSGLPAAAKAEPSMTSAD